MPEANPIESVDDFARNISDGVALLPLVQRGTLWARSANSPWVSVGVRSRSIPREYLGESAIEQPFPPRATRVPSTGPRINAQERLKQPEEHFRHDRLTARRRRTPRKSLEC